MSKTCSRSSKQMKSAGKIDFRLKSVVASGTNMQNLDPIWSIRENIQ